MLRIELDKIADIEEYYWTFSDYTIEDPQGNVAIGAKFGNEGLKLLSEYYIKKYQATIYFPQEKMQYFDLFRYSSVEEFSTHFKKYLVDAKLKFGFSDEDTECRLSFYIGLGQVHAVPFVYMKENNEEGILYADSLGVASLAAKDLASKSGLAVYAVEEPRQNSHYGCKIDGLLFCRDATAKDSNTNQYVIPNLLSRLKSFSKDRNTHFATKLPLELLKTSQSSKFTKLHADGQIGKKIKNKTVEEFLTSNTDYGFTLFPERQNMDDKNDTDKRIVNLPNYLRNKNLKSIDKIETLFYLNQIQEKTGNFPDTLRLDFMKKAKAVLKSQGYLNPDKEREGLHQFATDYLTEITSTIADSYRKPI